MSTLRYRFGMWRRAVKAQAIQKYIPSIVVAEYLDAHSPAGVNLGCGAVSIAGWLNVDFEYFPRLDVVCDLTKGLPFIETRTFDAVYSEHFMEHIGRKDNLRLLRECYRVLKPGGRIRIALPDLDKVVNDYVKGDTYPTDEFAPHYGGLFHTRGELLDIAMRAWGHTYLYNFEDISLSLKSANFSGVERVQLGESATPFLRGRESRPVEQSSLIVEAVKHQ